MKASTRKFAIIFDRKKNRMEKIGIKLYYSMISKMYADFLKKTKGLPPNKWTSATSVIKKETVEKVFLKYYPMFAELALMQRKSLIGEKSIEDDIWINTFELEMKKIVRNTAGEKIVSITNTTQDILEGLVRDVLEVGEAEGLGIPEIAKNLEKAVGANLKGNAKARARAIAQTEMISASNSAALTGAKSTGLDTIKFWSTSGLDRTRETHLADENYSDKIGGLKPNEVFPNTGLRFPADPSGSPAEVINCRCSLLIEVV